MKTDFQTTVEELGFSSVPIFTIQRQGRTPYLVGSGTYYRHQQHLYLITARHVVDELNDGFISTSGNKGFIRFQPEMAAFNYVMGNGRDHDLCVIRIPDEVVGHIHPQLRIAEVSQVGTVEPYDKLTLYAFVGYPHSRNKPKPHHVVSKLDIKPFYYVVREFRDVATLDSPDKSPELHIGFNAPFEKATDAALQVRVKPPTPKGISGCGVWRLRLNRSGMVTDCRLVGVGIEYLSVDKAFIATRIEWAISAISQHCNHRDAKPSAEPYGLPADR